MERQQEQGRRRRRAVGPAGARPADPEAGPAGHSEGQATEGAESAAEAEQRLRAERPPHHDRP